MPQSNRRRAERVSVGILAELQTPQGPLTGQVRDLSRSGVRVRIPLADLDLKPSEDLDAATAAVNGRLHRRFRLSLNHDRLGSLLQRRVELARVEMPGVEEQSVDLCCKFGSVLTEDEVELLESHLPPVRPAQPNRAYLQVNLPHSRARNAVVDESSTGPLSVPRPEGGTPADTSRPRQRYRAFVSAVRDGALQTFRCHTDLVTGVGVRIAVPRKGYATETTAAADAFVRRYGAQLELRLTDEIVDIWSGRVRVSGVELPANRPEVMLVTLAFDRALALGELRSLGLVDRVA